MFRINRKFRVNTPISCLSKTIEILEAYDVIYERPKYKKFSIMEVEIDRCFIDCIASEEKMEKLILDLKTDSKGLDIELNF
jgi:hypothetical protein